MSDELKKIDPTEAADDFYVGYLPQAPTAYARFTRRIVFALTLFVPVTIGLVAAMQRPNPSGAFEFGVTESFSGTFRSDPIPRLQVTTPGGEAAQSLLLVGPGKFGIPEDAGELYESGVQFDGSLIYRQNMAMIEMNAPDSIKEASGSSSPRDREPIALGRASFVGELVDTKCYFGVMRPGFGKVHRACAVRCLDGGVPPGILVRGEGSDEGGTRSADYVVILAGREGAALDYDTQWAATTVAAAGKLEMHDGLPILRVESLRRVDSN